MKAILSKPVAAWAVRRQKRWVAKPVETQQQVLQQLLHQAKQTQFGQEHQLKAVQTYEDFKTQVPIRNYEQLAPYIDQIKAGAHHVLWPGRPLYWAKTSGTTLGSKHIPITQDSLPYHTATARQALFNYIYETGKTDFLKGSMIFLSGSPQLAVEGGIPTGRLSGIVNHHVPSYLKGHQLPSYATNCIEDWKEKLTAIVEETLEAPKTLISGIPPWIQDYLDRLQQRTGKLIKDIFPHFSLLVHGGVNFAPYRTKLFDTIGQPIDTIETYPASEGFIAFQDLQHAEGLLLQLNSGMFFEFIPISEYATEKPTRHWIQDVEVGVDYALVLSSNAGLWAYDLGDTVRFVSKNPYRIVVTGRVKHFTSAFGEHVIAEEVDHAMQYALGQHPETVIAEFPVAHKVSQQADEVSCHEWLIEFVHPPKEMARFAQALDQAMCRQNVYYQDLIRGKTLHPLQITLLPQGTFQQYMHQQGKLGGQNKVVRLTNDRTVASALLRNVPKAP